MKSLLRRLYRGWMVFGRALGHANTFLLLIILYAVVLPFFSLSRFKDPLLISRRRLKSGSFWQPMKARPQDLESLYRPF